MRYFKIMLIAIITVVTICNNSHALNEIKISDRPDVTEICNKYGLDKDNFIIFKDNKYIRPNGKEIKITEANYTKAIEGKFVTHPKNNKLRMKVEKLEFETYKDEVIMFTKFTVNSDNKDRYNISLSYGDIKFPIKIDKCYFINTSMEQDITKYELTINKKVYYVTVDKSGGITGNIIKLSDGTTIKVLEVTEDIKPFLSNYDGPAMNIEYTDKFGIKSKSVLLYVYPRYEQSKRPFDILISNRKTKYYHRILGYCD